MRRPSRSKIKASDVRAGGKTEAAPEIPELQALVAPPALCHDLPQALSQEWLVTNGIGGYASSTILGVNTRRYHGLLVAATRPPGGRAVMLAKVEETLVTPGARHDLSTNRYHRVIHPEGYHYQEEFRMDPWPAFIYRVAGIILEKRIRMIPGENTVLITYHLKESPGAIELIVRPLLACRDFRWVSQENPSFQTRFEQGPGTLILRPYEGLPALALHHGAELFEPAAYWYKNFEYPEEASTETAYHEDLYSPGQLVYLLRPAETAHLLASLDKTPPAHLEHLNTRLTEHRSRILQRIQSRPAGPWTKRLMAAAESFFAKANDGTRHLLSGYPWGTACGREALMALPGLALSTGQPEMAREILQNLISNCRDGLLPVRFTEEDASPEYDSVDASLWLFWATDRYLRATGDLRFVSRRLLDVLMDIVDYYVQGTQFHIVMDQDGLITTEGEELPLTWMDARAQGHAATPRQGKAVEVNLLWHHALMTMADLGERFNLRLRRQYARLAKLVRSNFVRSFWDDQRNCLYDVVHPARPDGAVRPNQLLALSLPYPVLNRQQGRALLETMSRELATPLGLRSLSPSDPAYQPQPGIHHQGCIWPWWWGHYLTAYLSVYGKTATTHGFVRQQLQQFHDELNRIGLLDSVPELFSPQPPHTPAGLPSHMLATSEILRIIHDCNIIDL
ncbi:MAG: glycogen debranching enzyme N-terminal domain-containing protein [Candidatus Omnitrophica bacterium]|nr:glycogen debranching enzyme N-terminal domain-containing protein [Candidatus Omnitrophota bacterium]